MICCIAFIYHVDRVKSREVSAPEHRLDPVLHDIEGSDHPWIASRKIILDCMDSVVEANTEPFSKDERAALANIDRRGNYESIVHTVSTRYLI